jgi:DNA-binding NarL/FixJ family response regulator
MHDPTKLDMTEAEIDGASFGATGSSAESSTRVLIALAMPFLRTGVRKVLDEAEDMQVVGEVSEIEQVVPAIERLGPDIAVVDSDFHRAEPKLVEAIREAGPAIGVIVMVNHSDDECVIRSMLADPSGPQFSDDAISKLSECCLMALRSSARGCVPKVAEPDRLIHAIRTVAAGGLSAGGWLGSMVGRMSHSAPEAGRVTGRELEIISLVARGLENKEIAAELEIAEQTVKNHLSRVMKKLSLRNRQEVAIFAVRVHLDTPG